MPLKKCAEDQKSGYKWGNKGKCFTGPDAKKKAIKQGVAIEGPEKFAQKATENNIYIDASDVKVITDWMYDKGYRATAIVATASMLSSQANKIAGYPPDCNKGYIEKEGKCVPKDDHEY